MIRMITIVALLAAGPVGAGPTMVAPSGSDLANTPTIDVGDPVCANCSEGTYFGQPAHWWHGTDGCGPAQDSPVVPASSEERSRAPSVMLEPGCKYCDPGWDHCFDDSIPHDGDCPFVGCGSWGGGGSLEQVDLAMIMASVRAQEVSAIAAVIGASPESFGVDLDRSAFQVYNCDGAVMAHVTVPSAVAGALSAALEAAARE